MNKGHKLVSYIKNTNKPSYTLIEQERRHNIKPYNKHKNDSSAEKQIQNNLIASNNTFSNKQKNTISIDVKKGISVSYS